VCGYVVDSNLQRLRYTVAYNSGCVSNRFETQPLNIEARYPSHKERLMKSLTKERCLFILENFVCVLLHESQKNDLR
jgi:hypothetical protein